MPKRHLTVPGRFECLAQIAEFVSQVMHESGFGEDDVFQVQMAVDEACSNIIEHAYGKARQGNISLTFTASMKGDLVVVIRDTGFPFDPTAIAEPPLGATLENMQEGGLGLYFMRKLMDEVCFEFDANDGNQLTMIKRRSVCS